MAGKLIDIFQNCKCVNEEKHLAAGEVRSLTFGDNNTVMVVELGLHEVVSRKVIAKAEKQIADTYGLDRVMIEPRYNMPGELSNAYIKSLYDDMAYRMPSAKGLLDHRKWAFADGALQIPMDEVSEKHFANALRHLEARIQRELGRSCPVHAVRADAQDFAPTPEQEESREEILHKAVEQAAAAAAETPKPKKPRPAPQQHTGYQRPRAEKVREDDLIFGKLIQDPIVSVNEAIAAYDMVTIQGEVFFTDNKDIHSKKTGKDYVKIAFDMTDRTNSVRVSKFLAADKAGDTASKIKKGLYCTVQGKMVYDTFAKEMVLEPTGIVKAKKPERRDTYEGMKRVERFLKEEVCPDCGGTRLSGGARAPLLRGIPLDAACTMPLSELTEWVRGVPESLPDVMRPMAQSICEAFTATARRLLDLGLGYLSLDRSAATLSTGERQRMQLARAVRNRTTGVLYVLDEPSIGLHPSNIVGLTGVMHDLVADGNSVLLVDHDTQILREADWIVEMGPEAGARGGHVIAEGPVAAIAEDPVSQIGPFLAGRGGADIRRRAAREELFAGGEIRLSTRGIHTVKPLEVTLPKGRLTVVTGVSGSGKTTMVLESLVPALQAQITGAPLPAHVKALRAEGIRHVKLIDATPIGLNVRSTVATYANVHDELRKLFARSPAAKERSLKAGDFSYNTGSLRCPGCDGTGVVSLDVQFLPDVTVPCPDCRGSRYGRAAQEIRLTNADGQSASLPGLMDMDVTDAAAFCRGMNTVRQRLETLRSLGLGYLTLGEETPSLSGGEAQRLKLASETGRTQTDAVFVFDEPSIGLHPLDVRVLLGVFQTLLDQGATVVVIEHDLDVIRSADYIIDMGPGGGDAGGRIVACGTPEDIRANPDSITGKYL